MRFICDVHISFKIAKHLSLLGYETIHVNDILDKWFTKDREISAFADQNDFILITKDSDFKNSFAINHTPRKLIKINLGNISNQGLVKILSDNLEFIEKLNSSKRFMVEISPQYVVFLREDE